MKPRNPPLAARPALAPRRRAQAPAIVPPASPCVPVVPIPKPIGGRPLLGDKPRVMLGAKVAADTAEAIDARVAAEHAAGNLRFGRGQVIDHWFALSKQSNNNAPAKSSTK